MVYSETNSGLEEIPVAVVSGWGLEKVNLSIPLFFLLFSYFYLQYEEIDLNHF